MGVGLEGRKWAKEVYTHVRNRVYKRNMTFHLHESRDQIISRVVSTDLSSVVFVTNKASLFTCHLCHLICVLFSLLFFYSLDTISIGNAFISNHTFT